MPPKSPYRFTGPQVEWLKRRLGSYMKAFDNEDSVNAIPHFVDKTCTDLRKEFKTADKDTKAIRQSIDMWFNYKAQRIEKKRMIAVELRVHGIDMFRQDRWESTIRPAVVKTLGHDNNRSKEWIGTVKKIEGSLWRGLSEQEKEGYEHRAKEINEKNGSREHKITYADNFFKKKLKKFITDLAGLCEARIMVWTIRDTLEGKEKLVSIIEDDTGPKFMHEKHRDDLNDVNWYGGEWLEWMERRSSSSTDNRPVRNIRDYFLTVGPSGEMMLPSPDTHATGSNWASPLAQLIQIAWGRANGLKKQLVPKYKIFAANPEKYLDVTMYLPPPEMLKEDFVWVKPSTMPAQQLLAWAVHLYARQQRKEKGEEIEVLAFYVVDKRQRSSKGHSSSEEAEPENAARKPVARKVGARSTAIGSGTLVVRPDLSDDEEATTTGALEKNIVFATGSPGAAGNYWKQRIVFLKSLCQSAPYLGLVCWLQDNQKRSSLSPPDGWSSQLMWSRWTYTNRWLPVEMYEDESGFESIQAYVKQWSDNVHELSKSKSHIEHLLLTVGMLSRDIYGYQFSTADPDDLDHCPSFCHNTLFNITYHEDLMKLVKTVHENARLHAEIQAQQKATSAPVTVLGAPAAAQRSSAAQPSTEMDPEQQSSLQGLPPAQRRDDVQGAAHRRPRPRQPQRKGNANANTDRTMEEYSAGRANGMAKRKSATQYFPDGSSNRPRPDEDQDPTIAQQTANGNSRNKRPSKTLSRKTAICPEPTNSSSTGVRSDNRSDRLTLPHPKRVGRVTEPPFANARGVLSPDEPSAGRKSGRLREKGPTTYTAKGEIIRGGKRVNDQIHEQPFAKRVRYEG